MGNKSWTKVILIFRKKIKLEYRFIQEDKLFDYNLSLINSEYRIATIFYKVNN